MVLIAFIVLGTVNMSHIRFLGRARSEDRKNFGSAERIVEDIGRQFGHEKRV